MGKKQKKQSVIAHKDAFQRMNYLYQAAMAALSSSPAQPELSRFYIHTMKTIGKRLVLRMDPCIKRTLCKSCDTLLIPGVTCTHRIRCPRVRFTRNAREPGDEAICLRHTGHHANARREKHVVITCLTCGRVKRFLARKNYKLWSEKEENTQSATPTTDH